MTEYFVRFAVGGDQRGRLWMWDFIFVFSSGPEYRLLVDSLDNCFDDAAGGYGVRCNAVDPSSSDCDWKYFSDPQLDTLLHGDCDKDSTLAGMVLDRLLEVGPPEVVAWLESKLSTVEV